MNSIIKKIGLATGLMLAFTLSARLQQRFLWMSYWNRLKQVALPMRLQTRQGSTSSVPTVQLKASC